ncbi:microprocessor complex subunit DGCR8-like [Styela clava]
MSDVIQNDNGPEVKNGSGLEEEVEIKKESVHDDVEMMDDSDHDDEEYEDEELHETENNVADGQLPSSNLNNSEDANGENQPEGLLGYKYKTVLKHVSPKASTEPLPEGWVVLTHTTGIPLYLHKKTKVVTLSRPFTLLHGFVGKHKIRLQSIPCLYYKKNLEKLNELKSNVESQIQNSNEDTEQEDLVKGKQEQNANGDTASDDKSQLDGVSQPKVILHDQSDMCIEDKELKEYLEKRFVFETLKIPRFKKWSQRRDFTRNMRRKKLEENDENDSSKDVDADTGKPGSGKLITLTVEQEVGPDGTTRNRKFVLNTNGKPMVCILHEYAQRVLKVQPNYIFNTREDSAEPFETVIKLNGKVYGTAVAINKKTAKNKAALATLEMLIPGFKGQVEGAAETPDMAYFNDVLITDSRVYELCIHTGQLLPYQMLTECLKRNQGVTDTTVSYDVQQGKRRSLNYTMKCGIHVVSGVAKNKKIGKQMAAQQILQLLHPEIKTWMELITLYGASLAQERARRKREEQEIFDLKQRRGNIVEEKQEEPSTSKQQQKSEDSLEPNPELLAKLQEMMFKLESDRGKRKADNDNALTAKKAKLTPMEAAVAAGKGMLNIPIEMDLSK